MFKQNKDKLLILTCANAGNYRKWNIWSLKNIIILEPQGSAWKVIYAFTMISSWFVSTWFSPPLPFPSLSLSSSFLLSSFLSFLFLSLLPSYFPFSKAGLPKNLMKLENFKNFMSSHVALLSNFCTRTFRFESKCERRGEGNVTAEERSSYSWLE